MKIREIIQRLVRYIYGIFLLCAFIYMLMIISYIYEFGFEVILLKKVYLVIGVQILLFFSLRYLNKKLN